MIAQLSAVCGADDEVIVFAQFGRFPPRASHAEVVQHGAFRGAPEQILRAPVDGSEGAACQDAGEIGRHGLSQAGIAHRDFSNLQRQR